MYDPTPSFADLLNRQADGERVHLLATAVHDTLAVVTAELFGWAVESGPRAPCAWRAAASSTVGSWPTCVDCCAQGLRVLVGWAVPVGDGGISYGVAAVAAARLAQTDRKG
ncbi:MULTISPECIES: hypothetical protein [unclassified Streptomyces]|uniref:hypothetical protein n=1 Tax=unclassified Streptomyces TaxID=2593676 RepID=UPI000399C803|nr:MULTISPECIES: hypothetical protein [unclassified Streptomyces]